MCASSHRRFETVARAKDRFSMFFLILVCFLLRMANPHPLLVRCTCGVKVSDEAEVLDGPYDPNAEKKLKVRDCLGDVFGESGIRWYLNGPFDPNINYVEAEPIEYKADRAAQRLMRFGYKCEAIQLIDPKDAALLFVN